MKQENDTISLEAETQEKTAVETGKTVISRTILRERIVAVRQVTTDNGEQVVITTDKGKELWANPKQCSADAEEVRFRAVKAGDTYVYNKETKTVKKDGYWFVGAGKAYVDPTAKSLALLEKMAELGMNNAINL